MRKCFLILQVILIFCLKGYSQAGVSVDCSDHWGPGRYNKISVSATFRVYGFARFTQDFPVGFEFAPGDCQGGDVSWTGNQMNAVFMEVRPGKPVNFNYFIKPDINMSGNFNLHGELVLISGGEKRYVIKIEEKLVGLSGTDGLLPEEMKNLAIKAAEPVESKVILTEVSSYSSKPEFRVQVSASSKVISETKLRKDFGIPKELKITIARSGSINKYQAGQFVNFESASKLLMKLKEKGVKGAFIVAYVEGKQVDVEQARTMK